MRVLDDLVSEPGCFYVLDRGYLDFSRLFALHQGRAFFVIRAKSNLQSRRIYSRHIDKAMDLTCDQTIVLTGVKSRKDYPDQLRNDRYLTFLTNNFLLPALTIAMLYKLRW